jgi:DNA-binding Lrp family transcriptional regulator
VTQNAQVKAMNLNRKLLAVLQEHGALSDTVLAEKAEMTVPTFRRHVKRLEDEGVLDRRGRLNAEHIGLHAAIIAIGFGGHAPATRAFEKWANETTQVVWWWAVNGPVVDYIFLYHAPSWDDIKNFAYTLRDSKEIPFVAYQATYELGPGHNKHVLPLDHIQRKEVEPSPESR